MAKKPRHVGPSRVVTSGRGICSVVFPGSPGVAMGTISAALAKMGASEVLSLLSSSLRKDRGGGSKMHVSHSLRRERATTRTHFLGIHLRRGGGGRFKSLVTPDGWLHTWAYSPYPGLSNKIFGVPNFCESVGQYNECSFPFRLLMGDKVALDRLR